MHAYTHTNLLSTHKHTTANTHTHKYTQEEHLMRSDGVVEALQSQIEALVSSQVYLEWKWSGG